MADESFDGSTDDLNAQIKRLEKEKEELEKKNRERQQLEQRLKQLKGSVSSLKSGKNSASQSQSSSSDSIMAASLEESQARLRSLQESVLGSPHANTSIREEDDFNRSVEEFEDDVMTAQHKQALRENRDVLVENMTPDDLFNDLISKHILSNADVSRIKEKNTVETINEELLNMLVRRSDRAFTVFVSSLRRTLQGWLANRLDPQMEKKGKRKRRTGELNVDVECERVLPQSKKRYTCTCREVEDQILIMAKVAFTHTRRRDGTAASFEQFKKELHQTNEAIKDSMEILHSLKILCRHGELSDLSEGSVRFTIKCSSFASCQKLWRDYKTGTILQAFETGMITPSLLKICGARRLCLHVRISELEYLTCALELGYQQQRLRSCQPYRAVYAQHPNQNKEKPRGLHKQVMNENSPFQAQRTSRSQRVFKEISPNILPSTEVSSSASSVYLPSRLSNMDYKNHMQENISNCSKKYVKDGIDLSHIFPFSVDDEHFVWGSEVAQHSPVYKTRSKTLMRQTSGVHDKNARKLVLRRHLNYNLRYRVIRT